MSVEMHRSQNSAKIRAFHIWLKSKLEPLTLCSTNGIALSFFLRKIQLFGVRINLQSKQVNSPNRWGSDHGERVQQDTRTRHRYLLDTELWRIINEITMHIKSMQPTVVLRHISKYRQNPFHKTCALYVVLFFFDWHCFNKSFRHFLFVCHP